MFVKTEIAELCDRGGEELIFIVHGLDNPMLDAKNKFKEREALAKWAL
ncbi:hypothetical protein GCM10027295_02010 [Pseudaeromonas pectinilytica]